MTTNSTPDTIPATACLPWCTHPAELEPVDSPDSGCWGDETTVPAKSLRDGWTVQLQAFTLDSLLSPEVAAEIVSQSGVMLAQGDMHPVVMSPAEARQLAAALIDHAGRWESNR